MQLCLSFDCFLIILFIIYMYCTSMLYFFKKIAKFHIQLNGTLWKTNIILYIAFANKTGPFFIPYACVEAIDNNHVGFFRDGKGDILNWEKETSFIMQNPVRWGDLWNNLKFIKDGFMYLLFISLFCT